MLAPGERTGCDARLRHAKAPGVGLAGRDPPRGLAGLELATGAGIDRGAVRIARPFLAACLFERGDGAADFRSRAEARVDEALPTEFVEMRAVKLAMLRLAAHRALPRQPEPFEVLEDRRLEFRPAARRVDILDAQQNSAAASSRRVTVDERRERVAKMQIAVRARRETKDRARRDPARHAPVAAPSPSRRRRGRSRRSWRNGLPGCPRCGRSRCLRRRRRSSASANRRGSRG